MGWEERFPEDKATDAHHVGLGNWRYAELIRVPTSLEG